MCQLITNYYLLIISYVLISAKFILCVDENGGSKKDDFREENGNAKSEAEDETISNGDFTVMSSE